MTQVRGTSNPKPRKLRPITQRRYFWLAVAILFITSGIIGSLLGARTVARNDGRSSSQAFAVSSMDIASTLKLSILHEEDLVVVAGAFAVRTSDASESSFLQLTSSVRAFERYPELEGIAEVAMVPASELSAFAAREVADPDGPLSAAGTFQVIPTGIRPYYCLDSASQSRSGQTVAPAGTDYCETSLGPHLLEARDSGQAIYLPYGSGRKAGLILGTPVYSGGIVPTTVEARRADLIGWTGTEIRPSVILDTALGDHHDTAVVFRYDSGTSKTMFKAGSVPIGAQSTTINLGNGWHVEVLRAIGGTGVLTDTNSLTFLLAGLVISLLVGSLICLLGTGRSRAVTMVHERTNQLQYQAFHDSLTGLPNRALILDRLDQMMARSRREHTPVAALFLDLDDFKSVNDTLGHNAGDQLLAAVGARLASALREGDSVGRLGGDEFVVLVEGASLAAGAKVVAQRVLDLLAIPFEISRSDAPLVVTTSIGIAMGIREESEDLLHDADIALYRAKTTGKQRAVVFASSMQVAADDHRRLDLDLRRAFELDQFFLLYQPIVDLATGALTGVEALLRWRHPERGVLEPSEFISALESSGLIVPVGRWVLHAACSQGANWQHRGHLLTVSVNISALQLEGNRIIEDVFEALSVSDFDPGMLIVEITETTLMNDVSAIIDRLDSLKAVGVRIAIDDFGTGYSSLACLRKFPIDVLKIDQSFVSGIDDSADSAAIVHTLVQLGKALRLEIVAEGIETQGQRMRLEAEGVDNGQGHLFARPLDVEAVNSLFARHQGHRTVDHGA
jgi:diguanylate cyclase (GGDEF)-like protein